MRGLPAGARARTDPSGIELFAKESERSDIQGVVQIVCIAYAKHKLEELP